MVGDIYRVETGMIVPADSVVIKVGHLKSKLCQGEHQRLFQEPITVNEQNITGEKGFMQKYEVTAEDLEP